MMLERADLGRRVVSESSTGSTEKSSVRVTLVIRVESLDFDTFAGVLRVNGRTMEENKHVKVPLENDSWMRWALIIRWTWKLIDLLL
jgi:stalled ribosome rescue protein Dom34